MKPIFSNHIPRNEQTTPLTGTPYYRSAGLIKAWTEDGMEYAVATITLERFDEQNFQYIFTPIWQVIDALPVCTFQGIPGLDLDLRLRHYYRVNMTPVFIAERSPGKNREDLWELMESVGLDYYDRFEWLLRTELRAGTDNLIVRRLTGQGTTYHLSDLSSMNRQSILTCRDTVILDSFQYLTENTNRLKRDFTITLSSGAAIFIESEQRTLPEDECCAMLKCLLLLLQAEQNSQRKKQSAGIENAKKQGKYTGRKKIEIDTHLLSLIEEELSSKQITVEQAMARLGLSSRATFYRRLKEYRAAKSLR